ncbi:hypothetical protein J2S41_004486 [Catenuloplanes atrovinosus]|uniref:Transcriptional regulator n=2 Tax=Catenuloplanes atrovinosus TaxID=137266 RepID=A0AAE4CB41_9ACTN|nr:hypothetical protein [Catenuloplanes atrovinosus]
MSQADLGVLLFVHRDLVRKIETAERVPSADFLTRCDQVLEAHGALARLVPVVERERVLRAVRADQTSEVAFRSSATDRPVLDWLLADSAGQQSAVDNDITAEAARELEDLRDRDHAEGAGATYPDVEGALRGRLTTLATTAPQIATGMLELAGYEAVDLGVDGLAQQHYLRALDLMTRTGNHVYGGYLIAVSLAHLALHCGDEQQALRLATAGLRGTGDRATPAVRAAFRTVQARAYARRRDESACATALLRAEADLARSNRADEPYWIGYFGEADFADEKAHCFFDLGLYGLTRRETRTALTLLSTDRVRRIGIDTALQASALARGGELDEACSVARRAIDHMGGLASFRAGHRIVLMLAELQPYAHLPQVRDVIEYADATLGPLLNPG